jgi:hypothetical protein
LLKGKKKEQEEEARNNREEEGLGAIEKMKRKWNRFKRKHLHTDNQAQLSSSGQLQISPHEENVMASAYPILETSPNHHDQKGKFLPV